MLWMWIRDDNDHLKVERLYKQYSRLMFSEANKILRDWHLAEDAVQQSFLKIIKSLHKIDEKNCPRTRNFMVITCVNVAKSIYNKKLNFNKLDYVSEDNVADTADTDNDPLDILVDKDSVSRITKAIKDMEPIYRDVLLLKQAHKYSREEIAEFLEIPEETVKKRLARARKMLVQVLSKEDVK
jgi:RNA polymerase sigma-70 factor (ECF subfamily)